MPKDQVQDFEYDDSEDQLDEFDASYGDPSHIDDATKGQTPKRRADKRQGEMRPIMQGSSKAGKTAQILRKVNEMDDEAVAALLDALDEAEGEAGVITQTNSDLNTPGQKGRIRKKHNVEQWKEEVEQYLADIDSIEEMLNKFEQDGIDTSTLEEDDDLEQIKAKYIEAVLPSYNRPSLHVTAEDVDISEDITTLFESDDSLSDDFKEKAALIFEAVVVSKINESLDKLATLYDVDFEERVDQQLDEMASKMDDYLDYVVSHWMENNELAIEAGIRSDMSESLLTGLKTLFDDHYIEVPESKIDVVEELTAINAELEAQLSDQIDENIELSKQVEEFDKMAVVESVGVSLSESEKDKLVSLSEGIRFESAQQYHDAVSQLAETYFGNIGTNSDVIVEDDYEIGELENLTEEISYQHPGMNRYVQAISSVSKIK